MSEPVFIYGFSVWPCEGWGHTSHLFKVFDFLKGRIEIEFTKSQFESFRSGLNRDGFSLREIERFPYNPPETIL
jgi:hypothetical protein